MSKTLQGDILSLSEAWVQSHKSALLNVVPIDHTKDVVDLVTTCAAQCQTGYDVSLHCTDAHVQTDTMSSIPLLHVPPLSTACACCKHDMPTGKSQLSVGRAWMAWVLVRHW